MSLTSVISGKSERDQKIKDIIKSVSFAKKDFYTASGKSAFASKEYEELVPYNLESPSMSNVVGTASDYIFRIILANIIGKENIMNNIVAQRGLNGLGRYNFDTEFLNFCSEKFNQSIKICNDAIETGVIDEKVVQATVFFSYLDTVVRAGIYDKEIFERSIRSEPHKSIVNDVLDLTRVFKEKFIKENNVTSSSNIIFNPRFGKASVIVGGADADVIIDGVLYDFKSTKKVGYVTNEVCQLIGYSILNEIYCSNQGEQAINKIAFYKSRFGETEILDINQERKNQIKEAAIALQNID